MKYCVVVKIKLSNMCCFIATNKKEFDELDKALRFYNRCIKTSLRQVRNDAELVEYNIYLYEDRAILVGTRIVDSTLLGSNRMEVENEA